MTWGSLRYADGNPPREPRLLGRRTPSKAEPGTNHRGSVRLLSRVVQRPGSMLLSPSVTIVEPLGTSLPPQPRPVPRHFPLRVPCLQPYRNSSLQMLVYWPTNRRRPLSGRLRIQAANKGINSPLSMEYECRFERCDARAHCSNRRGLARLRDPTGKPVCRQALDWSIGSSNGPDILFVILSGGFLAGNRLVLHLRPLRGLVPVDMSVPFHQPIDGVSD